MSKNKLKVIILIIMIIWQAIFFIALNFVSIKLALGIINICGMIIALSIYIFIHSILRPLDGLGQKVNKIAYGDLTKKVEVNQNSIFERIYASINLLILKIRKFINESNIMTDKIINHCDDLYKNLDLIKISSNETCKAINQISCDMLNEMKDIEKSKQYINEIVDEHKGITKDGKFIKEIAALMLSNVEDTKAVYDELIIKMKESAKSNIKLEDKIMNLNEKATKIQGITDVVNNISKSTHLLSLNASIEAARANKEGAGFTIVASEIRKLAELSSSQAKEIQNILNDIKIEILDIASTMGKEVDTINRNISFSSITAEKLGKIADESQNTIDIIESINKIIANQNYKISDIQSIIEKILMLSENTTSSTQEVAAASEEQVSAMENIFKSISNLKNMNKDMKFSIDSFAKSYEINVETKKHIENGFDILRKISKIQGLDSMDYKTCTEILKDNITMYPIFELFGLVQKDGLRKAITLEYTEEKVYESFSHRPYFKSAINGIEYRSEPYISVDTNNYCIAIAVPVKNNKSEIVGIIMGDLILG